MTRTQLKLKMSSQAPILTTPLPTALPHPLIALPHLLIALPHLLIALSYQHTAVYLHLTFLQRTEGLIVLHLQLCLKLTGLYHQQVVVFKLSLHH